MMRVFISVVLFLAALGCAGMGLQNCLTEGNETHTILWCVSGLPFAMGGLFASMPDDIRSLIV